MVPKAFASKGVNIIACFSEEVDRDRFLDLTAGREFEPCAANPPGEVLAMFEKGAAIWFIGAFTDPGIRYLNGDSILNEVYR